ncbi:hypothetical protein JAAARDRAFT_170061 [Jaapia argillacea MUCL 33604]|uniref:Ino eighty subunit 1 n=1 Tax=Jaapia argillacea MUCL 33604 TaxID=933084 RepID=A0A067QMH2_9AGAM|nr:hypothetical protein JAAARDRAFT_170061 [Jaapia argillacea MUCL 33604]
MASDHAEPSGHPNIQGWTPRHSDTPPQYVHRKTLPIKRGDAEPLSREDIQFDLLHYIFSDPTRAFTDQSPGKSAQKVTFAELYVNALFNSSKCSKVLKDKMVETPAFALEFAKICLLTNVGRINTTMAFFPEMKTALRSYHPVPSLQKTDGNAQDAPRIKNCLKAALLPSEFKTVPPSTPAEIMENLQSGHRPPTSVVNLIFVLSNHASSLPHFDPPTDFLDLFLPVPMSSPSRAKAFLWLIFYYLEGPTLTNPFADDYARQHLGKVPYLRRLSQADVRKENIDPPEEIEWGKRMSNRRSLFLQKLVHAGENEKRSNPPAQPPPPKDMGARRHRVPHPAVHQASRGETFHHYVPKDRDQNRPRNLQPRVNPSAQPQLAHTAGVYHAEPERTMLQHAWHAVMTADPLMDSDEEIPDDHIRRDLERRLRVINRLRGKTPSPPPPPMPPHTESNVNGDDGPNLLPRESFTGRWQEAQWD